MRLLRQVPVALLQGITGLAAWMSVAYALSLLVQLFMKGVN